MPVDMDNLGLLSSLPFQNVLLPCSPLMYSALMMASLYGCRCFMCSTYMDSRINHNSVIITHKLVNIKSAIYAGQSGNIGTSPMWGVVEFGASVRRVAGSNSTLIGPTEGPWASPSLAVACTSSPC